MKRIIIGFLIMIVIPSCKDEQKTPLYLNENADIELRVSDLVSRMTLEEKVGQLDMYSSNDLVYSGRLSIEKTDKVLKKTTIGSVHDYYPESAEVSNELQKYIIENTRLGIPVLFIEEALHGYQGNKGTAFPIPIGMGGMWDVELMEKIGRAIGAEARSVGVHMVLSPVLGIGREPRWGRVQETFGEDSYLAARNGVAIIQGMQGNDLTADNAIIAEPKHFGIHSIPEGGKNTAPVFTGERDARTNFLYVFEKAFTEAGALGAMAAYHEWDGVPAAADPWLLKEVLREEWGFKGMVLSDLGAIAKQSNSHFTASTPKEAITKSISAGLDMQFYDYSHELFQQSIIEAINDKTLNTEDLNRAVGSVLYVKFKLGLFENPYIDSTIKAKRYHSPAHKALALESANKSITLLQNKNNILPLGDKVKNIAVIGELANKVLLGGYSPKNVEGVSIINAFKETNYNIDFVEVGVPANSIEQIDERYFETENGDKGLLAEYFNNVELSGEPEFTQVETNLNKYWHNLSPVPGISDNNFSIRWKGYLSPEYSGTYKFALIADDVARLSIDGNVVLDNWKKEQTNSWSHYKVHLEKGKKYAFELDFAEYEDYAGMKLFWKIMPDNHSQQSVSNKILEAARKADVVVLALGEKDEESGEGKDKINLELNSFSKNLVNEVSKSGKPIVLVLQNGRPLALEDESLKVDAILETWYAGEFGGKATVDIITGKVNPSGKLPITFPRYTGQLPLYYNLKKSSTGGYVDGSNQPLFAFGHGINYSKFEYSDLYIDKPSITNNEKQNVKVRIKNISDRKGTEVVQLYISDLYSSVVTPRIQLRGFKRVELEAGEEKEVSFILYPDDLALWNKEMKRVVESGEFKIMVGAASNDIKLESSFQVK
ncbi:glycoside hydrolase family 3 N-terminal domain-containing protein [Aquimarina algiphila]|uniref:glycoside hydrolase family 3 N-terminal domain-containing protein n=1 Tax=Aquimarina algiphila TaxID=2047982 RepID=UPI00249395D1|nr:glycoside hydrolase family 3 N-terminal domain-containing protein [Aquimarina algiphila]